MRGSDNLQATAYGKCRDEAQIGACFRRYICRISDLLPDTFENLPVKCISTSQLRLSFCQSRLHRAFFGQSARMAGGSFIQGKIVNILQGGFGIAQGNGGDTGGQKAELWHFVQGAFAPGFLSRNRVTMRDRNFHIVQFDIAG